MRKFWIKKSKVGRTRVGFRLDNSRLMWEKSWFRIKKSIRFRLEKSRYIIEKALDKEK